MDRQSAEESGCVVLKVCVSNTKLKHVVKSECGNELCGFVVLVELGVIRKGIKVILDFMENETQSFGGVANEDQGPQDRALGNNL